MRILFVENRYKTGFWELIAKELKEEGHEIFWVVQNHSFKPSIGKSCVIPYPKKSYKGAKEYSAEIRKVISADRGLNFFKIDSDDFIFYYRDRISRVVDTIKPDIAFGESTLFHELLTIAECKKRNILYLHPITCRYPAGRISFYKYDTLEPFAGSGEEIKNEKALRLIDDIVHRKVVPDYMILEPVSKTDKYLDKIKLSTAYFLGEKYNTPNPLVKVSLEKNRKESILKWENAAEKFVADNNAFKVLYPLQMQPESNIDVWGYPHNNQAKVVEEILKELPAEVMLYIKPNPKSKYELVPELLEIAVREKERVVLLSHSTKMNDVFPKIDFVITVTGTISYECIWADKPFQMLGKGIQEKYCTANAYSLDEAIQLAKTGAFLLPLEDKIKFIKELVRTSYKAQVTDTLNGKNLVKHSSNSQNIIQAFRHILSTFKGAGVVVRNVEQGVERSLTSPLA